ncbi:MAG: glycerophosphoryl diester phosphodiesterase membrane domain-containing protein [Actinobacteria bacterium]|nr:glycerophosphoryl diester phosphodiesterase membrane domain-containing protein [Actinomycetota bacterium]
MERARTRPSMPVRRSIGLGYRLTFRDLGRTLVIVALTQGAVAIVAAPMLVSLFNLATRAAGLSALTTTTAGQFLRSPLGLGLAVLSLLLVVLALLMQLALYAAVAATRLDAVTSSDPSDPSAADRRPFRSALALLRARITALIRKPTTLLLIPYLLLLVPLGQAGIGSVLSRWVAVPAFVSDELFKEPRTAVLYLALLLVLWWLNLRLILTVPLLVLEPIGVAAALGRSWRLTRWRSVRVIGLLAAVLIPLGLTLGALALIAIVPVMISDAAARDASPVVAAIVLGLAEVVAFFVVGVFLLVQAQTLVAAAGAAGEIELPRADVMPWSLRVRRVTTGVVIAGTLVAAGGASLGAAAVLNEHADGATQVLAHRGFVDGGVENTIGALEAAHAAGADLVEMDVQQTSDGGWVLMHDNDLTRLAGIAGSVGRMTLAEATAVTVHDEAGHAERIPSLEAYLRRADELDQPLLIEVKLHGGESRGFVAGLLALIDRVDGADQHIYHSLSADVVAEMKRLRPELTVGFIVPLAFGGVPDTPADFLVVEQSVYSRQLRDAVWDEGKSLFVWTVQDAEAMRALYRDNVDGIITDHPDIALTERDRVADETGMTDRLVDAVDRLVATP